MLERLERRIGKLQKQIKKETNRLTKTVARAVLKTVVQRTPYDTTQALSNWRVGINQRPSGTIPPHVLSNRGASMAQAISIGNGRLDTRKKVGGVIHIANNLEYIQGLDNGTISRQPGSFVAAGIHAGQRVVETTKFRLE